MKTLRSTNTRSVNISQTFLRVLMGVPPVAITFHTTSCATQCQTFRNLISVAVCVFLHSVTLTLPNSEVDTRLLQSLRIMYTYVLAIAFGMETFTIADIEEDVGF